MTKQTRQDRDRDFILSDLEWPRWPLLPVKRYGTEPMAETGLIQADDKTTVIFGNLFDLPKTAKDWKALKRITYDSIEALLADGWKVD